MRLPTSGWPLAALGLLIAAIAFAGCFGGSENSEVDIVSKPDGPDDGEQNTDGEETDETGNEDDEEIAAVFDEDELLEIIGQAEGSGANPDNRTGAPATFPSTGCPPGDDPLAIFDFSIPTQTGKARTAVGCLRPFDLSFVTVTAPDGSRFEQFWTDGIFSLNFSLLDEPGPYEVDVQRRRGSPLSTTFQLPPFDDLVLKPIRSDDGWVLGIAGYGSESSVRVAVYAPAGGGAVNTALRYYGTLGEIPLNPDGTTLVGFETEEEQLCFYIDAEDEAQFPRASSGCMERPTLDTYYQPGDSTLAQALTDSLDNDDAVAIGAVLAAIDDRRGAAVATIINRTTGEPLGAAVFEGQLTDANDPSLASVQVVARDGDSEFGAAFERMCSAAAEFYVVIGNPCLRAVELPPTVVFELIEVKDLDLTSTMRITSQEAITDCLPYNPRELVVTDEGESGWVLSDGSSRMAQLDSKADAAAALTVAQYHNQHCFVGRSNGREDRSAYIADFWLGGRPGGPNLRGEDCITYDPANLSIVDLGARGWQLSDGRSSILLLDTKLDAQKALNTAAGFTRQCFLGRNNTREDRSRFTFQYWK